MYDMRRVIIKIFLTLYSALSLNLLRTVTYIVIYPIQFLRSVPFRSILEKSKIFLKYQTLHTNFTL